MAHWREFCWGLSEELKALCSTTSSNGVLHFSDAGNIANRPIFSFWGRERWRRISCCLRASDKEDKAFLFLGQHSKKRKVNGQKLKKKTNKKEHQRNNKNLTNFNQTELFFVMRALKYWSRSHRDLNCLELAQATWTEFEAGLVLTGDWIRLPFPSKLFCDSMKSIYAF